MFNSGRTIAIGKILAVRHKKGENRWILVESFKNCNPGKFNGSRDVHEGANITQVAGNNSRVTKDEEQGCMEGIQRKELRLYEKLNLGPLNLANLNIKELHLKGCSNTKMMLGNNFIETTLTKNYQIS